MSELNNVINRLLDTVKEHDFIINVLYVPSIETTSVVKINGSNTFIVNYELETDINYLIDFHIGNIIGMSFTDGTRYIFKNRFDNIELECHEVCGEEIVEDVEFFNFDGTSHWYENEEFLDFMKNGNYIIDANFIYDNQIKFTLEIRKE